MTYRKKWLNFIARKDSNFFRHLIAPAAHFSQLVLEFTKKCIYDTTIKVL